MASAAHRCATEHRLRITGLHQSGPTFLFPRAKNGFPVGHKDKETCPDTIFEIYSQFLLSFTILIQKRQITVVQYMLKYKFYWNVHKLLQLQNIKFAPATACIWQFLHGKLTFCGRVLKSIACVALVHKTVDEIRIMIFFKSFGEKKTNELVSTGNKLT
jgi:hypothetical protein